MAIECIEREGEEIKIVPSGIVCGEGSRMTKTSDQIFWTPTTYAWRLAMMEALWVSVALASEKETIGAALA